MPVPTSYTEETLAEYMHAALGAVADELGLSVAAGSYAESVSDVLLSYPTSDIASISGLANIQRLRILARREAWRLVAAQTAGDYDIADGDGAQAKRGQRHAQAKAMITQADAQLAAHDAAQAEAAATRQTSASVPIRAVW